MNRVVAFLLLIVAALAGTVALNPTVHQNLPIAFKAAGAPPVATATTTLQTSPVEGLDEYVQKAMQDWEVPGLAIAIVKDDKVVLAKGYGVREIGKETPVDEHTLFAIGSSTKAFTTAALGMLADEGKLSWDDPVTKYLPWFQLFDPWVTRELTIRDLVTHRSGLERADLLWYGSSLSRDEILRRIRYLEPTWSFRSTFGYQNIMFLAAGQVVAAVSGMSWDDFVKQRIFTPLGMTMSNTSVTALKKAEDVATPHAKIEGVVQTVSWRNIDNIGPAGAINSNVLDMAQWLRLQLGEGNYQGKQLLSSAVVDEMHTPQIVIPRGGFPANLIPETHFSTYGLGWFLDDYRGRKIVYHGGNIDGMSVLVAMIPEENLGLVVLTNMNGSFLPSLLMYKIFDAYLGAPARDLSALTLPTFKTIETQAQSAEQKMEASRVMGTKPSLLLEEYAGIYTDKLYGDAKVTLENGKLVLQYGPALIGGLEHWHYDTFRATWRDRLLGKSLVTFTFDAAGKADGLKVTVEGQPIIEFKRAPNQGQAISLSEAELSKFVGKFESTTPPIEVTVQLVGGQLKLVISGQPPYAMIPIAPTRFRLEGLPEGYYVQFQMADDGSVNNMTIEEGAAGSFTLAPKK
jgi:CubicO group peptidase (beta-lactamase class C family)